MAGYGFIGTWEVISCGYIDGTCSDNQDLEGIRFRLEENGDVTWTVPEELKTVPLFNCETYEIYTKSVLAVGIRFGAYAGRVLEFRSDQIDPGESVILTCEGLCMLHCKRVNDDKIEIENNVNSLFSLLPALEDGYFSDTVLNSSNNKQFNVHSSILQLQGGEIEWISDPPPFNNLPEDALGTILHFLYAECLPENLTEPTARLVINASSQYACLSKLVTLCKLYLKNMVLKQQIIALVNDMHSRMNLIIDHFNPKNNHSSESITSNPAKLCFVVKQSIRDAAVAFAKLLQLCDLFTKRRNELSRSERHEIIRYAKSRLPIFLTQLTRFLQTLKNTFSSMSPVQRLEVATFLVPEIEVILDTFCVLMVHVEKAMQQIIHGLSPDVGRSKSSVGDMLGKSLRNVLHLWELTKLKSVHEHIICSLQILIHNKENFNEMSPAQKVRSIAINLEQLIEELPIFLIRLEEVMAAFNEKLECREFKFCFKVFTSRFSDILQKLVVHCDTLEDVMLQLCELVKRDEFTQSLKSLGLLDQNSTTVHTSEPPKMPKNSALPTPKHHHGYKLNLVESLCVPPLSNNSVLSKLCLQMLNNQKNTDMEFEIVTSNSSAEAESCDDSVEADDDKFVIRAHRVVLAARCDWFRRALLSGMREAIDKKIVIHDTSPVLFRIFLEYLYSGRLKQTPLSSEQLVELLLLSDRYEVDNLKQTTEYSLESSIDSDSALYFLSMADQYNARILKNSCLNFIAQHHELTESEVFFELPISLQAEIFDCVWTHPTPHKSVTMEQLLPTSSTPSTPRGSVGNLPKAGNLTPESHLSNHSSLEDLRLPQNPGRLDGCITQLRDIVGDGAARELLIQVILAADYDLCRAVNYYYARVTEDE